MVFFPFHTDTRTPPAQHTPFWSRAQTAPGRPHPPAADSCPPGLGEEGGDEPSQRFDRVTRARMRRCRVPTALIAARPLHEGSHSLRGTRATAHMLSHAHAHTHVNNHTLVESSFAAAASGTASCSGPTSAAAAAAANASNTRRRESVPGWLAASHCCCPSTCCCFACCCDGRRSALLVLVGDQTVATAPPHACAHGRGTAASRAELPCCACWRRCNATLEP